MSARVRGRAVWNRKQRGGMRRVTPLVVEVLGWTAGGGIAVQYVRRHRTIRRIVSEASLEPILEGGAT